MDFYEVLSTYYDEIFPIKEPQKRLVKDYLAENHLSSVLDVGCGTGSYTLELSKSGYRAMGVDLSRDMVRIAAARAGEVGSKAKFAVADMLDLSAIDGNSDLVLCIGNTLAHLNGEAQIEQALMQFAGKGRHLIIQVVNYDRILAQRVTELPEISTANLRFKRYYKHLESGYIDFSMEIEVFGEQGVLAAVNRLFPLTRARLENALKATGWTPMNWYGSFAQESWTENSPATIITAMGT